MKKPTVSFRKCRWTQRIRTCPRIMSLPMRLLPTLLLVTVTACTTAPQQSVGSIGSAMLGKRLESRSGIVSASQPDAAAAGVGHVQQVFRAAALGNIVEVDMSWLQGKFTSGSRSLTINCTGTLVVIKRFAKSSRVVVAVSW